MLNSRPIVFNRHSALCTGTIVFLLLILFLIMTSSSETPVFYTVVMLLNDGGVIHLNNLSRVSTSGKNVDPDRIEDRKSVV